MSPQTFLGLPKNVFLFLEGQNAAWPTKDGWLTILESEYFIATAAQKYINSIQGMRFPFPKIKISAKSPFTDQTVLGYTYMYQGFL